MKVECLYGNVYVPLQGPISNFKAKEHDLNLEGSVMARTRFIIAVHLAISNLKYSSFQKKLEKTVAYLREAIHSFIQGMGYESRLVSVLKWRNYMPDRRLPFF